MLVLASAMRASAAFTMVALCTTSEMALGDIGTSPVAL